MGSFVNAWLYRTHEHKSIVKGRSECPHCHKQIAWYDNIPVLSYLLLKAKCRYCHKLISAQYPLVEAATGILFASLWLYFRPTTEVGWYELLLWLLVTVFMAAAFVYDLRYMILPDRFMLPALSFALIYVFFLTIKVDQVAVWRLVDAAVFAGIYFLVWLFSKGKWIGDGDIRLAAIIGLMLSLPQLLIGVFAGYLIGSAIGMYLLVSGRAKRGSVIALGPFLIVGLYIGLFWGQQIANWYLQLI